MNQNKLSSWQISFLTFFPVLSFYNGIGSYYLTRLTGIDSYLAIIVAYLLGLFLLILFYYIFQYRYDENILEKNEYLFGNVLGKVINVCMNILAFILGVVLLYNISNFVVSEFLNQTPIWVFMLSIGLIIVFNVSKGIVNIARVAVIFLLLIFPLSLLNIFGLLPHFHIDNLKPFLEYGFHHVLLGGVQLSFTTIIPIFLLLSIKREEVKPDKKLKSRLFLLYSLAYLIIFLENILTVGSLSIYLMNLYQYPEYMVLQKISLFHFVDRIENFIYIKWILCSVTSLSLIIYYISRIFPKIKLKFSSGFIMILMILYSLFLFKTNTYFYTFIFYLFHYIVIVLFIFYLMIGLNIFIRKSYKKK